MIDYSINWGYIVETMREKFGIEPNSTEMFSMREIEAYIEDIWDEYVDKIDNHYQLERITS